MDRISKKAVYLYSIFLIIISVYIIVKTDVISRYVFTALGNELIPVISFNQERGYDTLCEIFPIFTIYEGEPEEEFFDNDNYQAYVWENMESTSVEQPATQTDSTMLAGEASQETDDTEPAGAFGAIGGEGIVYSEQQLRDFEFLISNCYTVASSTNINPDELNASELLAENMTVDLSGEDYKVLIYHTHGSEAYADSRPEVVEDTVVGVGDELTRILQEQYGVKVYHDRTVYDKIDGVLDTNRAYDMSAQGIDAILAEYPSIEVIIDIHRDGVKEDVYLMREINGVPMAQLMFVNGISRLNKHGDVEYLYNPYIQDNLAFSMQLHLAGKELYGDLFRKNYISGYRYNMHKMPKGALVEVGAQTNTVAEAKNAMGPLAETIYMVLSGVK